MTKYDNPQPQATGTPDTRVVLTGPWDNPEFADVIARGDLGVKLQLGEALSVIIQQNEYNIPGKVRNEFEGDFTFFCDQLKISYADGMPNEINNIEQNDPTSAASLRIGVKWGAEMAAFKSLERMMSRAQNHRAVADIQKYADLLKRAHFGPILNKHNGISFMALIENPRMLTQMPEEAYDLIAKTIEQIWYFEKASQVPGADLKSIPLPSHEVTAMLHFATVHPSTFNFPEATQIPVTNAMKYARRISESFKTARESIFEIITDTSHPVHARFRDRIFLDLSGADEDVVNDLYQFVMRDRDLYPVYRQMIQLSGEDQDPRLFTKLAEKMREEAHERFDEFFLEPGQLDRVIQLESEEGGEQPQALLRLRANMGRLIARNAQDVQEVNAQDVNWNGLEVPQGVFVTVVREKRNLLGIIFFLAYPEADGTPRTLRFFIDPKKNIFDWSILEDPEGYPIQKEILIKAGGQILDAFLKNLPKNEVAMQKPVVVSPDGMPVAIGRGKTNGNGSSEGSQRSTTNMPAEARRTEESNQKYVRHVMFEGPSAEVLRGIPRGDWRRIYRKIDDIRRGTPLKALEYEDALSTDGFPQFESKTAGVHGGYRIVMKKADGTYVVTKVEFRRDMERKGTRNTRRNSR